ncbi:MAG: PAS domain-containing sensor histidine kinase, partial [Betaproteobacteria bacterium]
MNTAGTPPAEDLEDLYENAPCGYLSLQPDGRIVKANATFSSWIGFSVDELLSRRLHDLLNVAGRIFYETHFAPLLRMQGFFNEVALDLTTRQGARLPTLVNAAERRDGNGNHLVTRLTVFNATDRRRYERELREARGAAEAAKKELEELNRALNASLLDEQATAALREQFIAVLGHDLRTPLSAVAAGTALIARMQPDEAIGRTAEMIQRSADRMAGLIENVLDFTRGRLGGGITLNRTALEPLEPVLKQVIDELQIGQPGRRIVAHIELGEPVDCDRRRIAQLFSNLLANALTHGMPDQPVRVGAGTSDDGFELWVANAGEPITPATMERLFQPFHRGEARASQQGLGLGLYIASQIARAHGGRITVESTPAETRFS